MTVSSPTRTRLARVLTDARDRRDQRLGNIALRRDLAAYRTSAELSELSAIAGRNEHVDTAALRTALSQQLSR